MAEPITLPEVNERGYYEIRLESIGGLGANLCGKMLGELGADYLGLNAANFSSYGSEKRGSPVKAYIRWCAPEQELRLSSPVEKPHVLGLFHEALAGKLPVTAGVDEKTRVVVNTALSPDEMREKLRLHAGELFCIDALRIAMECKTRVNMVMLGAMAKAAGFIPLKDCEELARQTVGKKYPDLLEANLEGVRRGWSEADSRRFADDGKYPYVPYEEPENRWGYENAPIGGVNPHIGSTVTNDLSASREGWVPLFIQDKCINCGLCDSTCPDMVFQFAPGEYKGRPAMVNRGLDYHHCKGCLRCVDVCPTEALVAGREREQDTLHHFLRNQSLLPAHLEYEDAGPDGWITSDSFDNERRVDNGGVV
ncbi:2-oxoacid:acceptor oxidoreductase family protein [Agathobaculum sp.]|uniref:2-oxoacid:acceptor oxidoreductase family protein n=1 Tax=Agathobaculum sp. TaxID=2048138 RepID=UPI002A83AB6B|nr:2-oxoacid:acceptor oxidoreductase family protein [Agathobaculum sp.]MDY3618779.1 2-oxoacid:acceptor oxidoreductase family protein [Agathobaculum sp.]